MHSISPIQKACSTCGRILPLTDYYVKDKATGRLFSWCKPCHKARTLAAYNLRTNRTEGVNRRFLKHPPQTEKRCSHCGLEKAASDFPFRSDCRRLRSFCTACKNKAADEYRARNREAIRASNAAYRAARREELRERIRQWRAAHPDAYRAIHTGWKRRNVSACRAMAHRRRASLLANGGTWTAAEWDALKARYGYHCLMCGRQEPQIVLHFDHVVPVSLGGPNTIANGQPLCQSCNSKKHRRVLDLRPA